MAKLIGKKADMAVGISWKFSINSFNCLGEGRRGYRLEGGRKCEVVVWETE